MESISAAWLKPSISTGVVFDIRVATMPGFGIELLRLTEEFMSFYDVVMLVVIGGAVGELS